MDSKNCLVGKKVGEDKAMLIIDKENNPMVFVNKKSAIKFLRKNGYTHSEIAGFRFFKPEYLITGVLKEVDDLNLS